jgi:hypothetical protein
LSGIPGQTTLPNQIEQAAVSQGTHVANQVA